MVQLPPKTKTKKDEPKNEYKFHDRLYDEDDSKSLKEEKETLPQTSRKSTWKRIQLDMYNYSLFGFICGHVMVSHDMLVAIQTCKNINLLTWRDHSSYFYNEFEYGVKIWIIHMLSRNTHTL
jgi:hypothetical protein